MISESDNEIDIKGTIQNIKSKPELNGQIVSHKGFLPNGRIEAKFADGKSLSIKHSCFLPNLPPIIEAFTPQSEDIMIVEAKTEAIFALCKNGLSLFFHISPCYPKFLPCDDGSHPPKYSFFQIPEGGVIELMYPPSQLSFSRQIIKFAKAFDGELSCEYFKSQHDMLMFAMNSMFQVTERYFPDELKEFIPKSQSIMERVNLNEVSQAALGVLKLNTEYVQNAI